MGSEEGHCHAPSFLAGTSRRSREASRKKSEEAGKHIAVLPGCDWCGQPARFHIWSVRLSGAHDCVEHAAQAWAGASGDHDTVEPAGRIGGLGKRDGLTRARQRGACVRPIARSNQVTELDLIGFAGL